MQLQDKEMKEVSKLYLKLSFIDCISLINNTWADNAKKLDVLMPMYNLVE